MRCSITATPTEITTLVTGGGNDKIIGNDLDDC